MAEELAQNVALPGKFMEAIGDYRSALGATKKELRDLENKARELSKKGGALDEAEKAKMQILKGEVARLQDRIEYQKANDARSISDMQATNLASRLQTRGLAPVRNPFSITSASLGLQNIGQRASILSQVSTNRLVKTSAAAVARVSAAGVSAISSGASVVAAVAPPLLAGAAVAYTVDRMAAFRRQLWGEESSQARQELEQYIQLNQSFQDQSDTGFRASMRDADYRRLQREYSFAVKQQQTSTTGNMIRAALGLPLTKGAQERVGKAMEANRAVMMVRNKMGAEAASRITRPAIEEALRPTLVTRAVNRYSKERAGIQDLLIASGSLMGFGAFLPEYRFNTIYDEIVNEEMENQAQNIIRENEMLNKSWKANISKSRERAMHNQRTNALEAYQSDLYSRGLVYQEI